MLPRGAALRRLRQRLHEVLNSELLQRVDEVPPTVDQVRSADNRQGHPGGHHLDQQLGNRLEQSTRVL